MENWNHDGCGARESTGGTCTATAAEDCGVNGKGRVELLKVRELTRVASPETEDTLLMIAQHGSAHHVETVVRHFRRAKEAQELTREQEQQTNRSLSYHFDDDGSLMLKARLPAEAGAVFMKALELSVEEVRANEPVEDESEDVLPRDFRASASHRIVTPVTDVPYGTSTVKSDTSNETRRCTRLDGGEFSTAWRRSNEWRRQAPNCRARFRGECARRSLEKEESM